VTKDCSQTARYNGVDLVLNFAVWAVKKCPLSVMTGVRYNRVFLTEKYHLSDGTYGVVSPNVGISEAGGRIKGT